MSRRGPARPAARRGWLGPLLTLVLLGCAGVIVADQLGYFGEGSLLGDSAPGPGDLTPGDLSPGDLPPPTPPPSSSDPGVPEPSTPDLSPLEPAAEEAAPLDPVPLPEEVPDAIPPTLPPASDGEGYGDLR